MSLHLLAGEEGPVLEACKASNIPCEVLPFPRALHTFGSSLGAQQVRSIWGALTQAGRSVAGMGSGRMGMPPLPSGRCVGA